jgi:hypothetical protein
MVFEQEKEIIGHILLDEINPRDEQLQCPLIFSLASSLFEQLQSYFVNCVRKVDK